MCEWLVEFKNLRFINKTNLLIINNVITMDIYHGSNAIVEKPEIRIHNYAKDFSYGFYCNVVEKQARKWATRFGDGFVNIYDFKIHDSLNILKFDIMSEDWLDFIVACRNNENHDFDIVEGPMADDTIFIYLEDYLNNSISRENFSNLARFQYPTHQICFHTIKHLKH